MPRGVEQTITCDTVVLARKTRQERSGRPVRHRLRRARVGSDRRLRRARTVEQATAEAYNAAMEL